MADVEPGVRVVRVEFAEDRPLADAVAAAERGDDVVVTRAGSVVAEVRAAAPAKQPPHDLEALRRLRILAKPLQVTDSAALTRQMRDDDEH